MGFWGQDASDRESWWERWFDVVVRHAHRTFSRRQVLKTGVLGTGALWLLEACTPRSERESAVAPAPAVATPPAVKTPSSLTHELTVTLLVNGQSHALQLEPRVSLLDALRERLALTGTKKGCDHGQCGACTVLIDGRRVNACLTLAVMAQHLSITTIEGLADGDNLHPVQEAFVQEDALQCGYCTPGQIMSAVALIKENRAKSDAEVREAMSGNLCRCGAYCNIVAAIGRARARVPGGGHA